MIFPAKPTKKKKMMLQIQMEIIWMMMMIMKKMGDLFIVCISKNARPVASGPAWLTSERISRKYCHM
jgi:hypothetical protein